MSTNAIGNNLKALRERKGYTQAFIAEYLGVDRSSVSQWENGERNISLAMLNRIADLYRMEVSDLLEEDESMQVLNAAFAFRADTLTPEDSRTIANFHRITMNYIKMKELLDKKSND